jgi:hypothetical protein
MTVLEELKLSRDSRQLVADRLILEYAGSVPPGQVLSAVLRVDRLVGRYDGPDRVALCESMVRRRLAEQAARHLQDLIG